MTKRALSSSKEMLFTVPSLSWMTLFFFVPTVIIFIFAFKTADIYGGFGDGWTIENFEKIFTADNYFLLKNTLWMSFATTAICLIIGLPVGYYIARTSPKVRQILLLMTVLPFWSSFIVRIYAWKSLLHPEGLLKHLLFLLNLVDEQAVLLYSPEAVILVMVYSYLPFAILPIYSAASKFNFHLFEAAMDLGMNRLQTFFHVFLPGIKQGILTAILMVLIPSIGGYVIPEVIGGPHNEMIGNKIVRRTFVERNLPQASALSALLTLSVLLSLCTLMFLQRHAEANHHLKDGT
jgi:spermidine/putrescine transport system permease protein